MPSLAHLGGALRDKNNGSDLERTISFYRTMTVGKNGKRDRGGDDASLNARVK
jgi:hypothetical protein